MELEDDAANVSATDLNIKEDATSFCLWMVNLSSECCGGLCLLEEAMTVVSGESTDCIELTSSRIKSLDQCLQKCWDEAIAV